MAAGWAPDLTLAAELAPGGDALSRLPQWCESCGGDGETFVIWSSSEVQSLLFALPDYLRPADVTRLALAGSDALCSQALDVFCALLGGERATEGSWAIEIEDLAEARQRYEPNTAVLITELHDRHGQALQITDFAPRFAKQDVSSTMASGASYGAAYSFAICVLMEMQWINSQAIHANEFFHGPFEVLDKDRAFLKKGGVMDDDFIDSYIELKMEEVMRLQLHPHPVEFDMYYSL